MSPTPVRFGVLGAGGFASSVMAPLLHRSSGVVLQAAAARSVARATARECAAVTGRTSTASASPRTTAAIDSTMAGDRGWVSIGAGGWDAEHRESWVRTDRVLAVAPDAVRREGAALRPEQFLAVVEAAVRGGRRG